MGNIRSLALYANIVPAIVSIILAGFVLRRAVDRPKAYLFAGFASVFALWLLANSILWNSNNYYLIAGFWSPMNYFELLFFLLLFCFFYLDAFGAIPRWLGGTALLTAAAPFVLNLLGQSVSGFDQAWCNVNNSAFLDSYDLWAEVAILIVILGLGIYRFIKIRHDKTERVRLSIVTVSIVLFMGIFSGSEYISSIGGAVYNIELYALFTLPIFILLLTIAITNYGTFRLGDTIAKTLFYIFLVFSGAEFFFVSSLASLALTMIAFLMTLSFGVLLLKSYEREVELRKVVEKQEQELEVVNRQQEGLLHFISHEVKGYLTNNEATFSAISTGDFGDVPAPLRSISESALADTRKGVATVMDILSASDLKKGTVTFAKHSFDLTVAVDEIVHDLQPLAVEKGLTLTFIKPVTGPFMFTGDEAKLRDNVIRNVIDNSIKYTPHGTITVDLTRTATAMRLTVTDTGVGITPEDMKNMFTEGGKGVDSIKVNVHSTGYGMFIAKTVTQAHGGKIWAESEGSGKGSRFIIEFPTA